MSTMTAPQKASKPRPFSCRFVSITIEVSDVRYSVDPTPTSDRGTHAFHLTQRSASHDSYDLVRTHDGRIDCSCGVGGCSHGRALVELGLMPALATTLVEPTPVVEPKLSDRCYHCTRLAVSPKLDADGRTTCFECRQERCDICERVGNRRVERRDGIVICPECSKRAEEKAELRAFLAAPAPAPCCSPAEPAPCVPCQAINTPAVLPDHYEDEPPTLDYVPTAAEEAEIAEGFAAMDCQRYLDRSATLPLPEAIDHISSTFRAWGSPFGSMLADVMGELAQKAFMTGATTPSELLTGLEALDREARLQWERLGYEEGRRSVSKPAVDIDAPAARRGKPSPHAAYGAFPANPCR